MGKKIDEETIKRINDLYLEIGIKKRVAEIVGVSPSTVSKYIIEGYQSINDNDARPPIEFNELIPGVDKFIQDIQTTETGMVAAFCELCKLTPSEWEEMKEIQKGLII